MFWAVIGITLGLMLNVWMIVFSLRMIMFELKKRIKKQEEDYGIREMKR